MERLIIALIGVEPREAENIWGEFETVGEGVKTGLKEEEGDGLAEFNWYTSSSFC